MHIQGPGSQEPLPQIKQPHSPRQAEAQSPSPPPPSQTSVDALQTQPVKTGSSQPKVALHTGNLPNLVQEHLANLRPILTKVKASQALSLPEKDGVINLLKDSLKDGSLKELAESLAQQDQLKPLHKALGTLINSSPGASVFAALFSMGLSLGVEAKENRAYAMEELLEKAGVSEKLLATLK